MSHSKRTGYLARFRPVLIASSRYLAYTSDVGESFRPVVAPKTVTAAYGISWAYLIGDVVYESWKAKGRASEMAPDHVSQVVGLTCVFFFFFFRVPGLQLVPVLDSGRVPSKLTTSVSAPCVFPSASLFSRRPRGALTVSQSAPSSRLQLQCCCRLSRFTAS